MKYVALLRAVNVGGTGKLPMPELKSLCERLGFSAVKTYIASGNVVFDSALSAKEVKTTLEAGLARELKLSTTVFVRTGKELAEILALNPFKTQPGNQTAVVFLHEAAPPDAVAKATGQSGEQIVLGLSELFIYYPNGMGSTKLRLPAAQSGTARNINTVMKLAELLSS